MDDTWETLQIHKWSLLQEELMKCRRKPDENEIEKTSLNGRLDRVIEEFSVIFHYSSLTIEKRSASKDNFAHSLPYTKHRANADSEWSLVSIEWWCQRYQPYLVKTPIWLESLNSISRAASAIVLSLMV